MTSKIPRYTQKKSLKNMFLQKLCGQVNKSYEMSDTDYNRHLGNNIKKCQNSVKHRINKETKKIAESLYNTSKRIECYASSLAFILIKDHKTNF